MKKQRTNHQAEQERIAHLEKKIQTYMTNHRQYFAQRVH